MLPQEKVKNLIDRHLKLEKELSTGEIDKKKYAEWRKHRDSQPRVINANQ